MVFKIIYKKGIAFDALTRENTSCCWSWKRSESLLGQTTTLSIIPLKTYLPGSVLDHKEPVLYSSCSTGSGVKRSQYLICFIILYKIPKLSHLEQIYVQCLQFGKIHVLFQCINLYLYLGVFLSTFIIILFYLFF